ncbi:hypothetical protein ACGFNP_05315 [Nonomuraea sp. NPDC049269]|uniref:hypothetical protein n=1 Tax=Nonomuraea sp. NPDC049269 TaxID=3364349 RepID=UPI00371AB54A
MQKTKKAATTLAIMVALGAGGLTLAAPTWADTTPSVVSSNATPGVWYIFNFYPDEGTCEAQRRWGASQGWWTWDHSACATNGRDWALFLYYDAAPSQQRTTLPGLPEGWQRA